MIDIAALATTLPAMFSAIEPNKAATKANGKPNKTSPKDTFVGTSKPASQGGTGKLSELYAEEVDKLIKATVDNNPEAIKASKDRIQKLQGTNDVIRESLGLPEQKLKLPAAKEKELRKRLEGLSESYGEEVDKSIQATVKNNPEAIQESKDRKEQLQGINNVIRESLGLPEEKLKPPAAKEKELKALVE